MKRILIALAIAASVQIAGAQVKPEAALKAVNKAVAAAENPKNAAKAQTWLNLGKAYVQAYDAPTGSIWQGASRNDLKFILAGENPTSTEQVTIAGQPYTKETYTDKNLYFNGDVLAIIEVTKPVVEDALGKALQAYGKAYQLDPKKAKDLPSVLQEINKKYTNDAYNEYSLGNYAKSSQLFEKAVDALAAAPCNQIDTNSVYNAGFVAGLAGDKERALGFYQKCYDLGYYGDGGDIYAKLADADPDNSKKYLEEGFAKFPQSQSIMIGLINYYISSGESTDRLFELLDRAKQNEPNNASLYYVEGNTRAQLKDYDKAVEAYRKCATIDPNYEYGYIGEGILHYNRAIELQEAAQNEMDDRKYQQLAEQFEKSLKDCIEPFEKAFQTTKDDSIKVSIAEYLKNAYYRFSSTDDSYKAAYDKYNEIVKTGVVK